MIDIMILYFLKNKLCRNFESKLSILIKCDIKQSLDSIFFLNKNYIFKIKI